MVKPFLKLFSCISLISTSNRSRLKQNKTFRVCILAADSSKLQSPEYWSAGITISEWEFRPKKPESGEGTASPKGLRGVGGSSRAVAEGIARLVEEVRSEVEGSGTDNG